MISCATDHPERKAHERFVQNITEEDFEKSGWKSKRIGKTAYTTKGKVLISDPQVFPLFITDEEYRQASDFELDI